MTTKGDTEQRTGARALEFDRILDEVRESVNSPTYSKENDARTQAKLKLLEFLQPDATRDFRNVKFAVAARQAGLDEETRERDFRRYLRYGLNALEPEERDRLFQHRASWAKVEFRAQGVSGLSAGGYLAPDSITDQIEIALKHYSAMRKVATVMPTAKGTNLSYPNVDDTSQVGELLAENIAAAEQDVTFNAPIVFKSWKYSSKLIRVSTELLQDSSVDVEKLLTDLFARRIGVLENSHLTTGDGTTRPQGVLTAATLGKTGAAGQVSTVGYDDFVDLLHSVDPLYRGSPNCCWMMADATLAAARKIKATTGGEPILTSASQTSENKDFILGYPVVVNPAMPVMAASAKSILFGDFSRYYIREVIPFSVLRLDERFADQLQTGFLAFLRIDGRLLDAGTHPIKFYANPAS